MIKGDTVNTQDYDGDTPLHLAINRETKHDIIRQFVNAGSDPNAKDKFGRTPNDHLLLRYKHRDEVEKEDVLYSIRMDPFGRMSVHPIAALQLCKYPDTVRLVEELRRPRTKR